MNKSNCRVKLSVFLLVVIICSGALYLIVQGDVITLGLDLQGGTYLLLEAESKDDLAVTRELMDETLAVIRGRVDSSGTREAEITLEGGNRVRVAIPGAKDSEEVFNLLHQEGLFEVVEIIPDLPLQEVTSEEQLKVGQTLLLGSFFEKVEAGYNEASRPTVFFTCTPEACQILCDFYTAHQDRGIKFTLDGELLFIRDTVVLLQPLLYLEMHD